MNPRVASLLLAATGLWAFQSAEACRFCQSGGEVGRYGNSDPMNAVQFDALVEPYRDMGTPLPKPDEIVTTKAALAQAAAVAVPQPGAEVAPVSPNSFRSRLLRQDAAASAALPPAIAGALAADASKVNPLGTWAAHAVDATILGALVGVVLFFRRGRRRQTA
jgi:hypothetical protein